MLRLIKIISRYQVYTKLHSKIRYFIYIALSIKSNAGWENNTVRYICAIHTNLLAVVFLTWWKCNAKCTQALQSHRMSLKGMIRSINERTHCCFTIFDIFRCPGTNYRATLYLSAEEDLVTSSLFVIVSRGATKHRRTHCLPVASSVCAFLLQTDMG
jgi:hypothetical protein